MSVDGEADREDQPLRGHFNQLRKLKTKHPHNQVLPSLGGIMFWEITGDDEKGSMIAVIERWLMGQRG
jgi:GH18 family chitinase